MMIFLTLLPLPLAALWFWWPVTSLGRSRRRWYLGITVAVAVLMIGMAVSWRFKLFGDAIEAWQQFVFGWLLVMFMLLLVFLLLRGLGWLLSRLAPRESVLARCWHGARLNQMAAAVIVATATLGTWNGLKAPQVREQELVVPNLPAEMDGLRMLVLADMHISPVKRAWRTQRIVDAAMAARPDVIVMPGDMVDGDVAVTGPHTLPLAQLQAPHGVWLSPGNHEYYHGYVQWMEHFRQMGLGVLENQSAKLSINGRTLAVSGIGDLAALKPNPWMRGGVAPDLPAVVEAAGGSDVHVLLAHQPKQAGESAASGAVDLQISGHTHGGHIIGFDRWVVAPANDGHVRGEYAVDGMKLFVSSGAGQWDGFTVRLGVPSSIDVLVLRSPQAGQ